MENKGPHTFLTKYSEHFDKTVSFRAYSTIKWTKKIWWSM